MGRRDEMRARRLGRGGEVRRRRVSVSEKGFEAVEPVAEPVGDGLVWDPVTGVHGPAVVERRVREPLLWRNPGKAKPDDQRSRLVMTGTGVFVVAKLNHWRKWVAQGVGVVDPVCYAEIPVPEADDVPWFRI